MQLVYIGKNDGITGGWWDYGGGDGLDVEAGLPALVVFSRRELFAFGRDVLFLLIRESSRRDLQAGTR